MAAREEIVSNMLEEGSGQMILEGERDGLRSLLESHSVCLL